MCLFIIFHPMIIICGAARRTDCFVHIDPINTPKILAKILLIDGDETVFLSGKKKNV